MRYLTALSFAAALLPVGSLYAQPRPANDDIRNAIEISAMDRIARVQGKVAGATLDPEVKYVMPDPLINSTERVDQSYLYPAVWYKWEAPISGRITSQVNGSGYLVWGFAIEGNLGDALFNMAAPRGITTYYIGTGTSLDKDAYDVTGGKTYYIGVLGGPQLSEGGRGDVDFTYIHLFTAAQVSDAFGTRTPIGGKNFSVNLNLSSLTAETDEPEHSTAITTAARKTGWLTYTSPTRRLIKLTAESRISRPLLAVYTGDTLATLTRVGQSSGSGGTNSFTATLNFVAEPGVPYAIAADTDGIRVGPVTLKVETATAAPTFLTKPQSTTVLQGSSATFTAIASATGTPDYQWQYLPVGTKKWVDVPENETLFTGTKTGTLNLAFTTLAMHKNKFRVLVHDVVTGTKTTSAAVSLFVTEFEAIQTEVLGQVDFDQIRFSQGVPLPTNNGTYFATGLPKGLTINPETGVITGTVTGKPGSYLVTYGSTNGKKRNPEQFTLLIQVASFSPYFIGNFEAILLDASPAPRPAGKLKLTVSSTGTYTGSYFSLSTSKSHSFRGTLVLDEEARSAGTTEDAPVIINRGKTLPGLQLAFTLHESQQDTEGFNATWTATLHEVTDAFVGDAVNGVKMAKFSAALPAPWAGTYTARLTTGENFGTVVGDDFPRGAGYATATISPNTGKLSLKGRLAEGTAFTASLPSSHDGKFLVAQRVHAGVGGSVAGMIALTSRPGDSDTVLYHSPEFGESQLFWVKTADKNYPMGLGPVGLNFRMEPWINPAQTFVQTFSLAVTGDFTVNLDGAAVSNSGANTYGLPIDLNLSNAGVISVPTTDFNPTGNSAKFKVSVKAATGVFTGSFVVTEALVPPAKKPVSRTVRISGVLFQALDIFTNDVIGEGYFLVPSLVRGSPVTSGLIEFRAGPPDPPFGGPVDVENPLDFNP